MTDSSEVDASLPRDEQLLLPTAPHDALSFEELAQKYNYLVTSDRRLVFARLVCDELAQHSHPVCALDVGCGTGISNDPVDGPQYLRAIARRADELWGVEPDTSIAPDHQLFTQFQHATLEEAKLPREHFDVAFSFFVMEHVADPHRFMRALFESLKPGGSYLFITPNARHYFTRMAKWVHILRIDEWLLHRISGGVSEEYHYPVQYRFNSEPVIRRMAAATGFEPPQFAYIERGVSSHYFPGPTIALCKLLSWKRKVWHSKSALLEMICRLKKPMR